ATGGLVPIAPTVPPLTAERLDAAWSSASQTAAVPRTGRLPPGPVSTGASLVQSRDVYPRVVVHDGRRRPTSARTASPRLASASPRSAPANQTDQQGQV